MIAFRMAGLLLICVSLGHASEISPLDFAATLHALPRPAQPQAMPQEPLRKLHQDLLTSLRQSPAVALSWPENEVPKDYQHFINKVLPSFHHRDTQPAAHADPNLLVYCPPGTPCTAHLIFTGQASPSPAAGRHLEVTAAYTSEFQYPVGFFAVAGEVINPALQPWDGLVVLQANGRWDIRHTDDPGLTPEPLQIEGSQRDYLQFIQTVEKNALSVFQSHLLVGQGWNLVHPRADQPAVRRRVLFRDRQGGKGLYDSLDTAWTLHELASLLIERYQAWLAVNLDMGSYNYCAWLQDDTRVRDCGALQPHAHISNFLRFSWLR